MKFLFIRPFSADILPRIFNLLSAKSTLRVVIILVCLTTANLFAQNPLNRSIKISYSGYDFEQALQQFEQATGATFQYNTALIPRNKPIKFNYHNLRASIALTDFLNHFGIDYELFNGSVILKELMPPEHIKKNTVSGRVIDEESKERLVKAYVSNLKNGRFCLSDDFGVFKLPFENDTLILSVYYDGFETYTDTLIGSRDYVLEIPLLFKSQPLPTIEINQNTSHGIPLTAVSKGISDQFNISSNKLAKMPALLGESDVLRALSMNPGVVGGSEGMLGMYVRGGSPDQNLILLDDVPIYNPYHLYGLFGTFNSDIVKSAQLFRGTMPTEYGGRLSSTVNVQSLDGNPNRLSGSVSLGIMSAKIQLQGPLIKSKTTFVFAARTSLLDFMAQPIANALKNDSNSVNNYTFHDINLKLIHRFSPKSVLTFSAFENLDRASFINSNGTEKKDAYISQRNEQSNYWGNNVIALKWELSPNPRNRITLNAYTTTYGYTIFNDYAFTARFKSDSITDIYNYSAYKTSNNIQDLAAKLKIEKQITPAITIKVGSEAILHQFDPGNRQIITQIDSVDQKIIYREKQVQTPEFTGYLHVLYAPSKNLFVDLGIRGSYFYMGDKQFYLLPEPRASLRYRFNPNHWIKLSASQNIQFFHLLNNIAIGLPSDIWVPSTTKFKPSSAQQFALGYTHTQPKWQFSTEVFSKKFQNLLEYKDNSIYLSSILNWEETVTQGAGNTYGAEFLLEKTTGKFTGWASYTFMNNTRTFVELNNGNAFPARYDRRHNLYVVGIYEVRSSFRLAANWVYNSGFAYTLPIGSYLSPTPDNPLQEILIYGDRNNARSLANHRLDINAQWTWKKHRFTHTLSAGVYNLYNRKNPFFINVGYDNNGNRAFIQTSLLPLLPQISYSLKF